ncbi:MAG: ribosomal protein S18-alanine N-acetyltransferase [Terracidiphilus sp.]
MSDPAAEAQIRRMAAADLEQVMELAANLPEAPHWAASAYLNALNPASAPHRIVLVLVEPSSGGQAQSGNLLGFAVASLLPPEAELESIAVASDIQRRGLGRRLFEALAGELGSAGALDVVLEVRASNHTALSFYRSIGFGKTGIRRSYYADPVEDAVLMRFRLG